MKPKTAIFVLITLALLGLGFYQGMYAAPTEQTMGDIQRIFYYHVPSAWTAFLLFFVNFVASVMYLIWKSPRTDAWAVASAEVGVVFCTVVLITGPLWAKPVWGIWWTWDARLTSTLVLWLIYVSYLVMRRFSEGQQTATLAAALAVFGFLDVPIVYMSIRWWRTQHPQPVIGGGANSGLAPEMWPPLLFNWLAFSCLAALVVWMRYSLARAEQELEHQYAVRSLEGRDEMETQLKRAR
ncbi:MAG: cytochrome c assembly protein [Acidobacteriales bacterium]|nr:cytochrome c assembly protein [Terriglobales bacterium]